MYILFVQSLCNYSGIGLKQNYFTNLLSISQQSVYNIYVSVVYITTTTQDVVCQTSIGILMNV